MELDVDQLATRGVTLAFERPFGRHRVRIGPSRGVSGQIASDAGGTFVEARTAEVLAVHEVVWQLREGAVEVAAELDLHRVEVALSIPRQAKAEGKVNVARAESDEVRLHHALLGDAPIRAAGVALAEVAIVIDEEGTAIAIDEARFDQLVVPVASERVTLRGLVLRGLVVRVPREGGFHATARSVESDGVELPLGATKLVLEGLVLGDAAIGPAGIGAAQVEVTRLALALEELGAGRDRAPKPAGDPLDLAFLDDLRGHLHLDLVTDIRIPVLGARRATHTVRLEVEDGMIQYTRLEKGLAALEDAVLDFAIRDGALVLDKDIPLIPFDRTTLVSWPLEPEEQRLADRGWVRLARLARPRLHVAKKEAPKEGDGMVREIRADAIDIGLSLATHRVLTLPSGAKLHLGAEDAPAVERLHLRGGVVYRPDGADERHALEADAEGIALGVEDMPIGGRRVTARGLRVARLTRLALSLRGIRPTSLAADLEGLALHDVQLAPRDG